MVYLDQTHAQTHANAGELPCIDLLPRAVDTFRKATPCVFSECPVQSGGHGCLYLSTKRYQFQSTINALVYTHSTRILLTLQVDPLAVARRWNLVKT